MLVLTRKLQEKIHIGDDIVITVLRTKGNAVRLGIEAPKHIPVLRGELAFEIEQESKPSQSETEPKASQPVVSVSHQRIGRSALLGAMASI